MKTHLAWPIFDFPKLILLGVFVGLFHTSCSTLEDYKTFQDYTGIYRMAPGNRIETEDHYNFAIRDDGDRVIQTEKKAQKRFESFQDFEALETNSPSLCSLRRLAKASNDYKKSLYHIKEKPKLALKYLKRADKTCPELAFYSDINLVKAIAHDASGKYKTARAEAVKFLLFAERSFPRVNDFHEEREIFHDQRELAKKFLKSEDMDIYYNKKWSSIKIFNEDLSDFPALPAGHPNQLGEVYPVFLPVNYQGSYSENIYGLGVNLPWKQFRYIPSVIKGDKSDYYDTHKLGWYSHSKDFNYHYGVETGAYKWKTFKDGTRPFYPGLSQEIYANSLDIDEDGYAYSYGASFSSWFTPVLGFSTKYFHFSDNTNDLSDNYYNGHLNYRIMDRLVISLGNEYKRVSASLKYHNFNLAYDINQGRLAILFSNIIP